MTTLKIKTKYGKLFTLKLIEQTSEFVSGYDKFGIFTRLLMEDILTCEKTKEVENGS